MLGRTPGRELDSVCVSSSSSDLQTPRCTALVVHGGNTPGRAGPGHTNTRLAHREWAPWSSSAEGVGAEPRDREKEKITDAAYHTRGNHFLPPGPRLPQRTVHQN